MYTDDELSFYSDDDVYGAESDENTTSQPIKASLADFLAYSTKQTGIRARKW